MCACSKTLSANMWRATGEFVAERFDAATATACSKENAECKRLDACSCTNIGDCNKYGFCVVDPDCRLKTDSGDKNSCVIKPTKLDELLRKVPKQDRKKLRAELKNKPVRRCYMEETFKRTDCYNETRYQLNNDKSAVVVVSGTPATGIMGDVVVDVDVGTPAGGTSGGAQNGAQNGDWSSGADPPPQGARDTNADDDDAADPPNNADTVQNGVIHQPSTSLLKPWPEVPTHRTSDGWRMMTPVCALSPNASECVLVNDSNQIQTCKWSETWVPKVAEQTKTRSLAPNQHPACASFMKEQRAPLLADCSTKDGAHVTDDWTRIPVACKPDGQFCTISKAYRRKRECINSQWKLDFFVEHIKCWMGDKTLRPASGAVCREVNLRTHECKTVVERALRPDQPQECTATFKSGAVPFYTPCDCPGENSAIKTGTLPNYTDPWSDGNRTITQRIATTADQTTNLNELARLPYWVQAETVE